MRTLYALIDYYNHIPDRLGRELDYAGHRIVVDRLFAKVIEATEYLDTSVDEVQLRFYGGWFGEDGEATEHRMQLGALIRDIPRRLGKRLRVLPSVADGLLSSGSSTLPATRRERCGFPPFRVVKPLSCPSGELRCAVDDLDSWRRGRCPNNPNCAVKTIDVVRSIRQKLVDTMIVSDQVYLSHNAPGVWVVTVSNDDDVIPGMLASIQASRHIALIRIGRREPCPYDLILEQAGIKICDLGG